ncbi:hypothetical protein SISSUDRAFT_1053056 [Sistotremastrum suecicum HHB10207 ss-3]|uniref:Uncharacterized protein n=1 Tax=Sistotremastrum suecicum HHB10207 ss-3 TaxID=1314776 RepID=A0A165ZGD1_9AGAM|nr:hypothetical protein SISSUDRAFT_1053056 [Sistotremastrum suecicum HHB10207 ss-3]
MNVDYTLRIPSELIVEIMWHYSHVDNLQNLFPARGIGINPMTRISCVCRRWRDIALGDHSRFLWSQIHLRWPVPVVTRYLERSGKNTLLSIGFLYTSLPDADQFARHHAQLDPSRIERLSVDHAHPSLYQDAFMAWIYDILAEQSSAKNLWDLELQFGGPVIRQMQQTYSLTALPQISDVRCPRIPFQANLLNPTLLTRIEIAYSENSPSHIINILIHSPLLQTAKFRRTSNPIRIAGEFSLDHPPTFLQHLKTLEFGPCHTPFANAVLQSVIFPVSSEITAKIYRDTPRIMTSFPETLEFTLYSAHTLTVSAERMRLYLRGTYRVDPTHYPFRLGFASHDSPTYWMEFNEYENNGSKQGTDLLRDIARRHDSFPQLKKATVHVRHLPKAKPLIRLLTSCKNLEDLTLKSIAVNSFIAAFGSGDPDSPLCPLLRKLDIRGSAFDPYQLKDTLVERKASNCPIQDLSITTDVFLQTMPSRGLSVDEVLQKLDKLVDTYTDEGGYWTTATEPGRFQYEDVIEEDDPDEMYEAEPDQEYGGYDDDVYDDY